MTVKARRVTSNEPVEITMSNAHAEVLRQVLAYVGGTPRGPRGLMNDIDDALIKLGVERSRHRTDGSVYFTEDVQ